jgi:predicted MFS family arabinose efflux permease
MNSERNIEKGSLEKFFIFSLGIAYFATVTLDSIVNLLQIEIASTFEVTLGAASQIRAVAGIAAIASGLLTGFLSIRFKHKSLVIVGLLFMLISGFGCSIAPSLDLMFLFFSFNAIASIIVGSMSVTIIGDSMPSKKKTKAVGLFLAFSPFANFITIIMTGFLAQLGSWRYVPLLFTIPVSVIALFLVYFGVPIQRNYQSPKIVKKIYFGKFKQVLVNKSATACLVGNILKTVTFQAIVLYAASFYRQRFLISLDLVVLIMLGGLLFLSVGNLVGGRLSLRFGRKPIAVLSSFFAGLSVIILYSMPSFWMALPFDYFGVFLSGIAITAVANLTLDQIPESRGTLMSLSVTFGALGMVLAPIIGGRMLDMYSFETMGLTLGATSLLAAATLHLLTKEPNKT